MEKTFSHKTLRDLSNQALTQRLKVHLATERGAIVEFLILLDEYDNRRGYEIDGYRSLFKYLTEGLHLAESSAAKRIAAMRAIRQWPVVGEYIAKGHIHLNGIYQLSKYLTDENYLKVFEDCKHRGRDWVEEYLAREFHAKGVDRQKRDVIRPIAKALLAPQFPLGQATAAHGNGKSGNPPLLFNESKLTESAKNAAVQTNSSISPVASSSSVSPPTKTMRISTDLDRDTYEDLKRARELLGAKDFGEVIGKALKQLLKKIDPNPVKKAETAPKSGRNRQNAPNEKKSTVATTDFNPQASEVEKQTKTAHAISKRSRYIAKAERQAVTQRDGYRCRHISPDGHRCTETSRLQLDHKKPFACGGSNSAENLEWVCDTHNRMRARQMFGDDFISAKILQNKEARSTRALSRGKYSFGSEFG